jgi:hypothetical protein
VQFVLHAEDAYFGQWAAGNFAARNIAMPGELHLTGLFEETPGAAFHLLEPCLTVAGRRAYKQELVSLLKELVGLEGQCDDRGRLARIRQALMATSILVDTIRAAKGES